MARTVSAGRTTWTTGRVAGRGLAVRPGATGIRDGSTRSWPGRTMPVSRRPLAASTARTEEPLRAAIALTVSPSRTRYDKAGAPVVSTGCNPDAAARRRARLLSLAGATGTDRRRPA